MFLNCLQLEMIPMHNSSASLKLFLNAGYSPNLWTGEFFLNQQYEASYLSETYFNIIYSVYCILLSNGDFLLAVPLTMRSRKLRVRR